VSLNYAALTAAHTRQDASFTNNVVRCKCRYHVQQETRKPAVAREKRYSIYSFCCNTNLQDHSRSMIFRSFERQYAISYLWSIAVKRRPYLSPFSHSISVIHTHVERQTDDRRQPYDRRTKQLCCRASTRFTCSRCFRMRGVGILRVVSHTTNWQRIGIFRRRAVCIFQNSALHGGAKVTWWAGVDPWRIMTGSDVTRQRVVKAAPGGFRCV